jgi:hypothetical protein
MLLRQIILEQLFSTPAGADFDVRNTLFFNILRANPSLAIFYADFLRRCGANSNLLKDLEVRSELFLIRIDPPKTIAHHKTGKVQPCPSTGRPASALTSRSTESAAAPLLCAAKFSVIFTSA